MASKGSCECNCSCTVAKTKCFWKDDSCYCLVACGPKSDNADLDKIFAEIEANPDIKAEKCECDCCKDCNCDCKCITKEGYCIGIFKCSPKKEGDKDVCCRGTSCQCVCRCEYEGTKYVFKVNLCPKNCCGDSCKCTSSCTKEGDTCICEVNCDCQEKCCEGEEKGAAKQSTTGSKCACGKSQCTCANCACKQTAAATCCKTKSSGK